MFLQHSSQQVSSSEWLTQKVFNKEHFDYTDFKHFQMNKVYDKILEKIYVIK